MYTYNQKQSVAFSEKMMKKEGFENLILTARIQGKRDRRKKRVTYLTNLYKWLA